MGSPPAKFQIGKQGINPGAIESLRLAFKTRKCVRISMLPSSGRDRNTIKASADELVQKLGGNYKYSVVGFTIVLRRLASKQ